MKHLKAKNIVRIIIFLYLIYCSYHCITNEIQPTYLDCGKVVSKSNDEVAIKRGVKTQLYLNIQFNKSGFRSIECNPTTYFSKQVGDNVCFNLEKDTSAWYFINNLIGLFVLVILTLIVTMLFVTWLMPDSWIKKIKL